MRARVKGKSSGGWDKSRGISHFGTPLAQVSIRRTSSEPPGLILWKAVSAGIIQLALWCSIWTALTCIETRRATSTAK